MRTKTIYLLLIILLSLLFFHKWLNFRPFTYSDWSYFFSNSFRDYLIPTAWHSVRFVDLGRPDVLLWRLPVLFFYSIFGMLHLNMNVAEKFVMFWQVMLIPSIGGYLLVKNICKSTVAGVIGSFVFAYNTYFLSIATQGHFQLIVGFGWATLAIYFFMRSLDEKKVTFGLLTALLMAITSAYDLRCGYILAFVLLGYAGMFVIGEYKDGKKFLGNTLLRIGLPFILFGFLSLYWVLPVLKSGSLVSNEELGRQLSFGNFYLIYYALTLHFPFWTGKIPIWNSLQSIPWYFWLYPILAFAGLFFSRKNNKIIFFAVIALIGILLSKQENIPFDGLYEWLYTHFIGFSAFREASKFYFLIAIGYAVLIGAFADFVLRKLPIQKSWFSYRNGLVLLMALLFLWNTKPLLTDDIHTTFDPHTVPQESIQLNTFIMNQPQYFRTLWIHMSSHWIISSYNHPSIDMNQIMDSDWKQYKVSDRHLTKGEELVTALEKPEMANVLGLSAIKYLIVPLRETGTNEDIGHDLGRSREFYQQELGKIQYLKPINIGLKDTLLYENLSFRPHLYATSSNITANASVIPISSTQISPSEYRVFIKNLKIPMYVHFAENYHPSWKLRIGNFSVLGTLTKKDYFFPDNYHSAPNVQFENVFLLDPAVISNTVGSSQIKKNSDGSINFSATIYFRPQSYLYLGLAISILTLLCIIGISIYLLVKNYGKYS